MANALREWYWSVRRHGLRQVVGEQASALGARIHVEQLKYNRVVMEKFANHGAAAAPVFAKAILSVWPDVRSMADFGCGTGHYVAAFRDQGVMATGYERSSHGRRYAAKRLGLTIEPFDLHAVGPTAPVEMAMSLEVIEHLTPELGERLLDVITRSPRVAFSGAQVGQGGIDHINEQPLEFWRARFDARGYAFCQAETSAVREQMRAVVTTPWLATNVMLFRRR
jgi:hypothetical protein